MTQTVSSAKVPIFSRAGGALERLLSQHLPALGPRTSSACPIPAAARPRRWTCSTLCPGPRACRLVHARARRAALLAQLDQPPLAAPAFHDSDTHRRLLLRLWLNLPDGRPAVPALAERAAMTDTDHTRAIEDA
ncbi:MAG: hypothetical protein WDN24_06190 [Sphingomonas sp.]